MDLTAVGVDICMLGSGPRFDTGQANIFNTTGNLHLDSANDGDMYLNWYSARTVQVNGQIRVNPSSGIEINSQCRLNYDQVWRTSGTFHISMEW